MKTESQESFNLQETMPLYIPQYILEQPQEAIKQVEWELSSNKWFNKLIQLDQVIETTINYNKYNTEQIKNDASKCHTTPIHNPERILSDSTDYYQVGRKMLQLNTHTQQLSTGDKEFYEVHEEDGHQSW